MATKLKQSGIWNSCDSRSDVESRVEKSRGLVSPFLLTEAPNSWGYAEFNEDGGLVCPIGYADVGLRPELCIWEDLALVGISEVLAAYSLTDGERKFQFRMPTIFHEFLRATEDVLLVRDEIGFVLVSKKGEEIWCECLDGPIAEFEIRENHLNGITEEGDRFEMEIPM